MALPTTAPIRVARWLTFLSLTSDLTRIYKVREWGRRGSINRRSEYFAEAWVPLFGRRRASGPKRKSNWSLEE